MYLREMYLREMGAVELLSREGEIAIAKRIEAGREKMIAALCESPLTIRAIIVARHAADRRRGNAARRHRPRRHLWRRPRCRRKANDEDEDEDKRPKRRRS